MPPECIVCYEERELVPNSACTHEPRLCRECWMKWSSTGSGSTCPVCFKVIDWDLTPDELNMRLYLTAMRTHILMILIFCVAIIAISVMSLRLEEFAMFPVAHPPIHIIRKAWMDMTMSDLKNMYNDVQHLELYINNNTKSSNDHIYTINLYNTSGVFKVTILTITIIIMVAMVVANNYITKIAVLFNYDELEDD